ncbi:MAG: hypothetical protein KDB14_18855 [Planctomycetales bacterium]|nr:hypothetical protein [Planctomycetales bacterium]
MSFLAFDIGGANLKVADGLGYAASRRLPMWKSPDLRGELRTMIANAPEATRLAITMTAELADCFESKSEGVCSVLDAVEAAADGRPVRIYRNDGKLVAPGVIRAKPLSAAAMNWHALARFAARWSDEDYHSLLIDVGSSTCDVIWLHDPAEFPLGQGDSQRLLAGELVYVGVERTPVCSLVSELPFRGSSCPIARELFATTRDVSLLLGQILEDPGNTDTADGRPSTKSAARRRMSRMVCADDDEFNHRDAVAMAQAVYDAQVTLLADGLRQVSEHHDGPPRRVIFSGHGELLARAAVERCGWDVETMSLAAYIGGPMVSRCAPAHALAVLAREAMQA